MEINRDAFIKTADAILFSTVLSPVAPDGRPTFDMENWFHECQSPSCIAGWAASISNQKYSGFAEDEARDFLGLCLDSSYALFNADPVYWPHRHCDQYCYSEFASDYIGMAIAARDLLYAIADGRVIWDEELWSWIDTEERETFPRERKVIKEGINVENIKKTAGVILETAVTNPRGPNFDMNYWVHRCGVPSCIAGWAGFIAGEPSSDPKEAASTFFGLDSYPSICLFLTSGWPKFFRHSYLGARDRQDHIGMAIAARDLLYAVAEGRVVFSERLGVWS